VSDRNPFEGPLAGVTGRLEKLRQENNQTRFAAADMSDQVERLVFQVGMLIDLVDELAWKVTPLISEPVD
jgi:hypothetical protein